MKQAFISFSALVLISIFLIFAFLALGFSSFYLFGSLNDERNFYQLKSWLESCVEMVISKIIQNSNYPGNEAINLENFTCNVYTVENSGNYKVIKIKGEMANLRLYLKVIFDVGQRNIIQWQFTPSI